MNHGDQLGKIKNKDHNEVRYLNGEIRKLEKKIRHLESENRLLKKWQQLPSQDEEIVDDTEETFVDLRIKCDGEDGCGKGYFKEIHIMEKIYGQCEICDRRKRLK